MTVGSSVFLVAGLGNPGGAYEATRHNVGFRIVDALARKENWTFRSDRSLHCEMVHGSIGEKKVLLIKPMTYMNSSGESLKKCIDYFKIGLTQVMIVCDDITIPFGALRLKTCGSSGGHNGLKSIESHLGTQAYARLRVGVGDRRYGDLADYVLSPFLEEEKLKLPGIITQAAEVLECWLIKGVVAAMQLANTDPERKKSEKI